MNLDKAMLSYKSLAKQYKAFLLLGEALEEIKDLDSYKRRAQAATNKAKKELEEIKGKLVVEQKELKKLEEMASLSKTEAEEEVKKAILQAKAARKKGNDEAAQAVADAKFWAKAVEKTVKDEEKAVKADIKTKTEEKDGLAKQVAELRSELAELKKRFE